LENCGTERITFSSQYSYGGMVINIEDMYSHHSIKRTGSIKRPDLEFFKKSLLNVQYDPKNEGLNIL
jgi:hypothetical protein